jgi:Protein of unknown function (DUF2500).
MFDESGFMILFYLVFFLIIGMIIYNILTGIKQWNKNNHSPRLCVYAKIVSKRTSVSHHHHSNAGDPTGIHGYHTTSSTSYFMTFEFDTGDRIELKVSGQEYGMLAEGDEGNLSFQGTRYLGFERKY